MTRLFIVVVSQWLLVFPLFAQGEKTNLTISYASHVQAALSDEVNTLYNGKFNKARNQLIRQLRDFAPAGDGVIDFKDISRLKDVRPRYFKILETIQLSKYGIELSKNLNSMGIYYHSLGQFQLADLLFTKCLRLQGEKLGKTSPYYIATLHNIANLRKDQGRFDAAEDIFKYVINYYAQINGEKSLEYIVTLNNKAMLDASIGRLEQATQQLDKAILLMEATNLKDVIDYNRLLVNRALMAYETKDDQRSIQLLENAKGNLEKNELTEHPDYNDIQILLSAYFLSTTQAEKFLTLIGNAGKKIEDSYGKEHPYYANVIELQAEYALKQKDFNKAKSLLEKVVAIRLIALGDRHPKYLQALSKLAISESNLGNVAVAANHFKTTIDTYLYLTEMFFPSMSEMEQTNFWSTFQNGIHLFYEFAAQHPDFNSIPGMVMDVQLNTKGLLLNNTRKVRSTILNSKDASLIAQFNRWESLKAELSNYYSLSKEVLDDEGIDLDAMEKQANDLEKNLIREFSIFSKGFTFTKVSWSDIASKLKDGEAAMEIIRMQTQYADDNSKVKYLALGLKQSAPPVLVVLNDGDNMEGKYFRYYKNFIVSKLSDGQSYNVYWGPFEKIFQSEKKIYLSPDGIYNNISLGTLKAEGAYLIDRIDLEVISSLKLLASSSNSAESSMGDCILIGNPAFSGKSDLAQLPGTEIEIKQVSKILEETQHKVVTLTGGSATEGSIKKINNPYILHIATHGFFLSDVEVADDMIGISVSSARKNPLLRSGLFLANPDSKPDDIQIERNDNGVLTAYEAMDLDLNQTSLVILSACETGLGEIKNGEGVYGLSRSFRVAGSQAVIISLWKVDDTATEKLMTKFYESWMKSNDLAQSFAIAQREVKKEFGDPYYWGPFVLLR